MRRLRRTLGSMTLFVGSLCVSLILAELILLLHNPFQQRLKGDTIVLPINRDEVGRRIRADGSVETFLKRRNSLGFRGPEPPPDFDSALTLIAVGGSTTEGARLPDGSTWTDLLAHKMRTCFPNVWINNAGFAGHSTFAHIQLMRDHIGPLKPNVVLFLVGRNDSVTDRPTPFDRESGVGGVSLISFMDLAKSLAARSEVLSLGLNLYRAVRAWRTGLVEEIADWSRVREGPPYPPDGAQTLAEASTLLPGYRSRLTRLIEITESYGILPVLLTQPMLVGPAIDPVTGKDLRLIRRGAFEWERLSLFNDVVKEVAARYAVPVIDLATGMPKDTRLFVDLVHFSEQGEEMVATLIFPELVELLSHHSSEHLEGDLDCRSRANRSA